MGAGGGGEVTAGEGGAEVAVVVGCAAVRVGGIVEGLIEVGAALGGELTANIVGIGVYTGVIGCQGAAVAAFTEAAEGVVAVLDEGLPGLFVVFVLYLGEALGMVVGVLHCSVCCS